MDLIKTSIALIVGETQVSIEIVPNMFQNTFVIIQNCGPEYLEDYFLFYHILETQESKRERGQV